MASHTIEVAGISDELLRLLDERVHQRGGDRADFVRDLLEKELQGAPGPSFEAPRRDVGILTILDPVDFLRKLSEG